jgi:glycosyltransferase involved in cell wall biosynthesis
MAALAGVPSRIAHQHDARSLGPDFRSRGDRIIHGVTKSLTRIAATRRIGITNSAIEDIAGVHWRKMADCSVLIYGFDFSSFSGAQERAKQLRRRLRLAPGDKVIGHVGRFDPVKNHEFLLRTFAKAALTDESLRLVMVGRGRLQGQMRELARGLGIADSIRFVDSTLDVAAYMSLFDLFLFPSFSEGLGIVCVEAQAAGTRVLASDTVPREAAVVEGGIEFLPLEAGEDAWALRAAQLLALRRGDSKTWRGAVERSAFGLDRCIGELHEIYRDELGRRT